MQKISVLVSLFTLLGVVAAEGGDTQKKVSVSHRHIIFDELLIPNEFLTLGYKNDYMLVQHEGGFPIMVIFVGKSPLHFTVLSH